MDVDAAERMFLFRVIERLGHRATVVGDVPAALELLAVEPYDLVLVGVDVTQRDELAALASAPVAALDRHDDQGLGATIDAALSLRNASPSGPEERLGQL